MSAEQISIMKLEHSMLFPKRKRKWQFGECRIIDFTNKCECIPRIDNTEETAVVSDLRACSILQMPRERGGSEICLLHNSTQPSITKATLCNSC